MRARKRVVRLDASMRPEHRCSGKHAVIDHSCGRNYGFNEAGASLLRKTFRPPESVTGTNCFNEAGASLLRKTLRKQGMHRRIYYASMRPEHRCSGKLGTLRKRFLELEASMRPEHRCSGKRAARRTVPTRPGCFNEAGASLLRKTRPAGTLPHQEQAASMRPEHRCSGKPGQHPFKTFSDDMLQ